MIRFKVAKNNHRLTFLAYIFIAILLNGCAQLTHLDNAQDNFNKGATLENAALFNSASISAASPQSYYNLAYDEASKALNVKNGKSKLQGDNLLGTAYSIKALAAWKLRKYDEARNLAKVASNYLGSGSKDTKVNFPRDYAVMQAMDALITIQETNDEVYLLLDDSKSLAVDSTKQIFENLIHKEDSSGRIEKAILKLDEIAKSVSEKHDVRVYFNMSQLAGLKIWSDAMSKTKYHLHKQKAFKGDNKTWYEDQEDLFETKKSSYLNSLAKKLPGAESNSVYIYWKFIL